MFESRGARYFVIMAARHVAHSARFARARSVKTECVVAAASEFETAEKHAHLFGIVHSVEHNHGGGRFKSLRLHEQGRQGGAFVGHLDELNIWITEPDPFVPYFIGVLSLRLFSRPRHDEALGIVVVDAGAQEVVAGSGLVVLRERRLTAFLY